MYVNIIHTITCTSIIVHPCRRPKPVKSPIVHILKNVSYVRRGAFTASRTRHKANNQKYKERNPCYF